VFLFSTSSLALLLFLDVNHSEWGKMESWYFDLHFLYGEGCWTFLHVHLLIGLFVLLEFNIWAFLYIMSINSLSNEQLIKIFSYSVGFLLILIIVFFAIQKLLNFSNLVPIFWVLGVLSRKHFLCLYIFKNFLCVFLSKFLVFL
jgi:hypothetical protein